MRKLFIMMLCFCMLHGVASAQSTLYNSGIFYIAGSTDTVYISGGLTNTSGAAFTNKGIVKMRQNINNDQPSMATGTGTLYLNGSSAQAVNGTQAFATYNLVTDNTAGITLNNNLSVGGVHSFVNGMITTSATPNYMIYAAGSSYTGASDERHVNGWVKKSGNTDFTFPVGSALYLRPVTLGTLTATGEFNVRYHTAPAPNRTLLFAPLVLIDTFEYWTINKISGAAAKVTMNWDKAKVKFPLLNPTHIRAAYFNGSYWTNIGGTGTGDIFSTGSVTSNSVTAFNNYFVIGSTAHVLAVTLLDFTATKRPGYNRVSWEVSQEANVHQYEVQRSDDGIHFYTVSASQPRNTGAVSRYSYDDRKAMTGTTYYRLLITEQNGPARYSEVAVIQPDAMGKLYVVNNPVTDRIDIYAGEGYKGRYTWLLAGSSGQVVQQGTLDVTAAGQYSIVLQKKIAAGMYTLVLRKEDKQFSFTVLKN